MRIGGRRIVCLLLSQSFFVSIPADKFGGDNPQYVVQKLIYSPNGTAAGDIITIKKSESNLVYKDIDVWTFQDQDNTQMHMYMPTYAFENFLANTAVEMMAQNGELDLNDAEAVAAIYDGVANAIETINVSFIFKVAK